MSTQSIADEITRDLKALGRGSRQGHRPSSQRDFGVYTPDLRRIVREYGNRLASHSGVFIYELSLVLLAKNITECRQVAYELIAGHRLARELLTPKKVEALGQGIDNWACVDSFCCTLVGAAWRDNGVSDATIRRWTRSDDLWWRRAANTAVAERRSRAVATLPCSASPTPGGIEGIS